jgi:hypothetical protein
MYVYYNNKLFHLTLVFESIQFLDYRDVILSLWEILGRKNIALVDLLYAWIAELEPVP